MIPAAFDYLRAHSPDEAFAQLQKYGADARVLAGGQSLIPAMRFRLARPAVLVDINNLTDLLICSCERWDAAHRGDRARQRDRARVVDRRTPLEPSSRCLARGRRSGRPADRHAGRQPVPQRSGRRLAGHGACHARRGRRARQGRHAHGADRRHSSSTASRPRCRKARSRSKRDSRFPTSAPPARIRRSSEKSAILRRRARPCSSR